MTEPARAQGSAAPLPQGIDDDQPARRIQAISEAVAAGDARALAPLLERLSLEKDTQVMAALLLAIGRLGSQKELPLLAKFIQHPDPRVRANVIEALYCLDTPVSLPLIVPFLEDPDNRVRANAALALKRLGLDTALEVVRKMVGSPHLWMRASGVYALGLFDAEVARPILEGCRQDANPTVREKAEQALAKLAQTPRPAPGGPAADKPGPEAGTSPPRGTPGAAEAQPPGGMARVEDVIARRDREALAQLAGGLRTGEDRFVTSRILSAIGILGETSLKEVLVQHLSHPDSRVASNAIWSLARLGDQSVRDRVLPFLKSMQPRLRANAIKYFARDTAVDLREPLREMLASRDPQTRMSALFCMADLERPDLLDLLDTLFGPGEDPEERRALFARLEGLEQRGFPQMKQIRSRLRGLSSSRSIKVLQSGVTKASAPVTLELPAEDVAEPPPGFTTQINVAVPLARWRAYFLFTRMIAVATDAALAAVPLALVYLVLVRAAGGAPATIGALFGLVAAGLFLMADPLMHPGPGKRLLGLALESRVTPGQVAVPPWRQLPVLLLPWGLWELWLAFRHPRGQRPGDRRAGLEVVPTGRPKVGLFVAMWAALVCLAGLAWWVAGAARPAADADLSAFLSAASQPGSPPGPSSNPAPAPAGTLPVAGAHSHETMGLALPVFAGWTVVAQGSGWAELRPRAASGVAIVAAPGEARDAAEDAEGWGRELCGVLKRTLEREKRRMIMWQPVAAGVRIGERSGGVYRADILGGGEAFVFAGDGLGVVVSLPAGAQPGARALMEQVARTVRPLPAGAGWRHYKSPFQHLALAVPERWVVERDDPTALELRPLSGADEGWLRLCPAPDAAAGLEDRLNRLHRVAWSHQGFAVLKQAAYRPRAVAKLQGVACELRDALGSTARFRAVLLPAPASAWAEEWLERGALSRPAPLDGVLASLLQD